MSFPKSKISDVRAYTRRDLLREDIDDLVVDDEDGESEVEDEGDDAPGEGWTEERIGDDGVVRAVEKDADDKEELD